MATEGKPACINTLTQQLESLQGLQRRMTKLAEAEALFIGFQSTVHAPGSDCQAGV
jgi:hypothetical protein